MSQPTQVFHTGNPNSHYSVIDNSPAGNNGVKGGPGYDTTWPGAVSHGQNVFGNGSVPDHVASAALKGTIRFKNPA